MIKSFNDKGLEAFANGGDGSQLSAHNIGRIKRVLASLCAATSPEDVNLPGYHFYCDRSTVRRTYSVGISENSRCLFESEEEGLVNVRIGYTC